MYTDRDVQVYLIDDHVLFRKGMVELVNGFSGFTVSGEADHGLAMTQKIAASQLPDIVLLDITMPQMNGYQTAQWLKSHYPIIKILALSVHDDESVIIKMIKSGAQGYILKDAHPAELKQALVGLSQRDFYYSDTVNSALLNSIHIREKDKMINTPQLNERELAFLQLVCSELTYREIAEQMCLSPRTIDGYRETLFEKFQVRSRVGLVLHAIREGMVRIDGSKSNSQPTFGREQL